MRVRPSPVMKALQECPCCCTVHHLQVNITHSDQTGSAVLLEAFQHSGPCVIYHGKNSLKCGKITARGIKQQQQQRCDVRQALQHDSDHTLINQHGQLLFVFN